MLTKIAVGGKRILPDGIIGNKGGLFLTEITRKLEVGTVEVAMCPLCEKRVEFIGAPMVRCYTTGQTYDPEKIRWVPESKLCKDIEYDVENIRGNDVNQDFMPNAHPPVPDVETA